MIQDIAPKKLYNTYQNKKPGKEDMIFCFQGRNLLMGIHENGKKLPTLQELPDSVCKHTKFLFSIDKKDFYINLEDVRYELPEFEYQPVRNIREKWDMEMMFAGSTAYHLAVWYQTNRFCGRCGQVLQHGEKERVLVCPECHNMVFPKIAPAVIAAVTDGDRILLTKYADREYKKYALIAGFTEIGETLEETVQREVMEEVGLKVKNIRYYKNQPWGFDSNLLVGFFAELDGDDSIVRDEEELAVAEWFDRNEMPVTDDGVSLTREMMRVFMEERNQSY